MINKDADPSQTQSSLEFILNTICKAFQMHSPPAAAIMLTNDNRTLVDACTNGYFGSYERVIKWFELINLHSMYLSRLINQEYEAAIKEKKKTKAIENIFNIFVTFSCGCLSTNINVVKSCMKCLRSLAQDIASIKSLRMIACQWMQLNKKDGGCYLLTHAVKTHPSLK